VNDIDEIVAELENMLQCVPRLPVDWAILNGETYLQYDGGVEILCVSTIGKGIHPCEVDREFIKLAINALPALLAERRELQERLSKVSGVEQK
jgi:hypothetical protein